MQMDFSSLTAPCGENNVMDRERALAWGIQDFAAELRLIDVVHLISYVHTEQHNNIADLVRSSAELFFKGDSLRYGNAANVDLKWGSTPTIRLDLEFHHLGVSVYFELILTALQAAVDMHFIEFESPEDNPSRNTQRLLDALKDARLSPPPSDLSLLG